MLRLATPLILVVCIALVLALILPFCLVRRLLYAPEPVLLDDHDVVHVNMTTIPERFSSDWFASNMRRMLTSMRGNFVWWCNIPPVFESTQEPYVVSSKVQDLLDEFPNFRLFKTEKDYGPITKVLGPLYNPDIPDTSALLICDDDIQYLPDVVRIAATHFASNPSRVYTFCMPGLQGYVGFVVQKKLCERIPNNMPASCRRIDDDLLDLHFKQLSTPVTYYGNTGWACTIDTSDWGDRHTPANLALNLDHRPPMVKACQRDFYALQKQQARVQGVEDL